jgi:hypothetical protein
MKNAITDLGNGLIAVLVDKKWTGFYIGAAGYLMYDSNDKRDYKKTWGDRKVFKQVQFNSWEQRVEILGTVEGIHKISFDTYPLVNNNGMGCYDNYKGIPDNKYTLLSSNSSFLSLLNSKGIYFENPMGKEFMYKGLSVDASKQRFKREWAVAQEKVIPADKKLLILKTIK